ncbi:hypothetical protein PF011_g17726 [Phytophthora fragariae]|uniref:Uncharacterized protein n=1 Tax=Phytophthora fragariae TaxID=53985 RepID=A0A6A3JE86_9STRA|nr:hypothetical protein PF011_g17726 [Phytophthora fragariae]KAE9303425.1 hypothetical protein PF008_g22231 [Phytophthora fragariae]
MSSSASGNGNSSDVGASDDAGSVVFTSAPKTEASNSGDSCTWYSGGICSRPRSCSDCLNVVIPGQDCAVSPYGECMNSYLLSSVGGYPMANFTYCSSDDAVCSACRANWTSDYNAGAYVDSTATCVGNNGCICIASCEMPNRDDNIVNNWCIPALDGSQFRLVAGLIAGTIALFIVATVVTKRQLARRQRQGAVDREARNAARAALRETRRPAASAHLPQLSLSGWADMREKLVTSEQSQLAGGSAANRHTLARTSTTPPAAIVEEGDAYRPMSPSEHPQRRGL